MSKKKSAQQPKRDVIKVEGQRPSMRPLEERISIMSRIERYILADVVLKRTMDQGFLTKAQYRRLSKEYADRRGLPENSIFRGLLEE